MRVEGSIHVRGKFFCGIYFAVHCNTILADLTESSKGNLEWLISNFCGYLHQCH